jgi:hypothetical protein
MGHWGDLTYVSTFTKKNKYPFSSPIRLDIVVVATNTPCMPLRSNGISLAQVNPWNNNIWWGPHKSKHQTEPNLWHVKFGCPNQWNHTIGSNLFHCHYVGAMSIASRTHKQKPTQKKLHCGKKNLLRLHLNICRLEMWNDGKREKILFTFVSEGEWKCASWL